MQIIFDSENKSVLRIEKGEECIGALKNFAKEKNKSFHFSMIGAGTPIELGYFHPEKKQYFSQEFKDESFEILSCTGNISWFENEPIVHAHGVFSNEKYECFGGHVNKLVISLTGEVMLDWLPEKIIKKYDEETGLKLFSK